MYASSTKLKVKDDHDVAAMDGRPRRPRRLTIGRGWRHSQGRCSSMRTHLKNPSHTMAYGCHAQSPLAQPVVPAAESAGGGRTIKVWL